MKNLYRKGKVHPSPPTISDHLALLPATILTLTAALSPEDKEVLAYLISCSSNTTAGNFSGHLKRTHKNTTTSSIGGGDDEHGPLFQCDCFRCYTTYWVRWDNSPNRQLIHEIIDAYEDGLFQKNKKKNVKSRKERKKRVFDVFDDDFDEKQGTDELGELESVEESCSTEIEVGGGGDEEVGLEKGSLRKLVGFIGERIWGVWYK